jgi:hypothetical protein
MALKINRTANLNGTAGGCPSSTLISARYEYRRVFGEVFQQQITVEVRDFADQHYELDDEAVKRLFDHIWKKVKANRPLDVVLDVSQIQSVAPRFERELGYLRRQLRQQGRSARLSNITANCEQARSLEIA